MNKYLLTTILAVVAANAQAAQPTPSTQYKPRTQQPADANRFYMEQNGKRMSAEEFDAWMKSRGIRVATGKPTKASDKPDPEKK
jgi:hypothetical protein